MTQQSAEEAAHVYARAVVAGDFAAMLQRMTPEALAKGMQIDNGALTVTAYDLIARGSDGEDFWFDFFYQTEDGPLSLRERFGKIDGEWKLVDVERLD